jgi:hypothetical protein
VGQRHRRLDEDGVLVVPQQALHERFVDLEFVDGQPAEVGQRRVAGAEVVEGQADAQGPQFGHDREGPLGVCHQRGLGELEAEQARRDTGRGERVEQHPDEVGFGEAAGRHVDADPDVQTGADPPRGLQQGQRQHAMGERDDDVRGLGRGDEVHQGDRSAGGVGPPQQRLDPDEPPARQAHLRLVGELELVGEERLAQVGEEGEPFDGVAVAGRVVQGDRHPVPLAGVERDVGAAQQVGDLLAQPGRGRHTSGASRISV